MWPDPDFLFGLIGALGVLIPLLGTPLVVLWRWCRRTSKQLGTFLEDWQGEAARPGVPARPGVMERLAGLEADTVQLRRNGGASIADKIEAIVDGQDERAARMVRIEESLTAVVATLRGGAHQFGCVDRAIADRALTGLGGTDA